MTLATTDAGQAEDLEAIECRLLLEAVHERYGFDFRSYARASIRRRIRTRLEPEGVPTVSGLLEKVLHDPECMRRLLLALTIHVTAMFRDPGFYLAFRQKVVPSLRTYPFVRIWHAGCSSGEEVYSMAILLQEEGLLPRCRIYATDISEAVLRTARAGVYPVSVMKDYTKNYIEAGGSRAFSEYYTADHGLAVLRTSLRDSIVFAPHNLATDASFNEFHVIVCRNVMIYFDRALEARVHGLLYESLCRFGVLALGRKESLGSTPIEGCYEELDPSERIFRKVR